MFVTKVILLVLCVALACCTRVSVMTFNLFYGGTSLNLTDGSWCYPKPHGCPSNLRVVADAIRYAGADIVGLEETEGNTQAIAELLGWHWSARAHVISRFPLAQPHDPAMRAVLVEVQPAQWMVVAVAHAPSDPYGPYWVRDGRSLDDVLLLEQDFRTPSVLAHLEQVKSLAASLSLPFVLVGDFNSPSQLDWTPVVVHKRGLRYSVLWPLGTALAQAGASDVFRLLHPDPVAQPGYTWSPWGPEDEPSSLEVPDRVDWILAGASGVAGVSAAVVGPPRNNDSGFWPWPSDHWAVAAVVQVQAKATVRLALGTARILEGEVLSVFFGGSNPVLVDGGPARLLLVPGWNNVSLALLPGPHSLSEAGGTRCTFSLALPGPATISLQGAELAPGEPLQVNIVNGPGMMLDYLAVYACEGGSVSAPLVYSYTAATVFGTVVVAPPFYNEGNHPVWPLPEGCFRVALLRDDDPTSLAAAPAQFVVVPRAPLSAVAVLAPAIAGTLVVAAGLLLLLVYRRRRAREVYQQL